MHTKDKAFFMGQTMPSGLWSVLVLSDGDQEDGYIRKFTSLRDAQLFFNKFAYAEELV